MKRRWTAILITAVVLVSGCSAPKIEETAERNEEVKSSSGSVFEQKLISVTTHARGICQNWLPETTYDTGLLKDINNLIWLVPRGAIGADEPASEQDASDNVFVSESSEVFEKYSSQMEEDWYFDFEEDKAWIRLNYRPDKLPEGINSIPHEDILLYIEGEDLYFAVQSLEDEELWTVTKVPGYGSWMEKEIEMFYRLYMGL